MKALLIKALAAAGLVPAASLHHAQARARQASDRTARLEDRVAKLHADVKTWKDRQQESAAAAAEWKKTAARADGATAKVAQEAARARAQADEWKSHAETLTARVRELREKLGEARRVATGAREHLMATEVKLDLVEAAIHVLDGRTRQGEDPRS